MAIKYHIKPVSDPSRLFEIVEESGAPVFYVTGGETVHTMRLYQQGHIQVASIRRIRFFEFAVYDIRVHDGGSLQLVQRFAGGEPAVLIRKRPWRLRGDLRLRSFDLLQEDRLLMSHGRCWKDRANCFAVEIHTKEVLLCLCIALAIDSIADGDMGSLTMQGELI